MRIFVGAARAWDAPRLGDLAPSGAGMRAVVDPPEPPAVYVAVDLRRREGAVAEQLLDRPQVGAALEQVGREGVPEPVGVRDEAPQRARVEPPAPDRQEERVERAARQRGTPVAQVAGEAV